MDIPTDKPTKPTKLETIGDAIDAGVLPQAHLARIGKQHIKDIGARLRQIRGLKLEVASIRTDEMIAEILERLSEGETVTSITLDTHMPAPSTFYGWCQKDAELAANVKNAQAIGQRTLADIRLDIAAAGPTSSGDARRDELIIKTINQNMAQRAPREFTERVAVSVEHTVAPVIMPSIVATPVDLQALRDASAPSLPSNADPDAETPA